MTPTSQLVLVAFDADLHLNYLDQLVTQEVVSGSLAVKAKAVWFAAQQTIGDTLPVPTASAIPDGPVEYHWSRGPHRLLVEIPVEGPCHWTYQNTATNELWGAEWATVEALPLPLTHALQQIASF